MAMGMMIYLSGRMKMKMVEALPAKPTSFLEKHLAGQWTPTSPQQTLPSGEKIQMIGQGFPYLPPET